MRKFYKLFRIKKGKLFPLYIYANEEVEIGKDLEAKEGIKKENGKVKSLLGDLSFRPGWHCCEFPLADHIGKRQPNGELYQAKNTVWCEVEVSDEKDYTSEIDRFGLKKIPTNGFYYFKTNPNAKIRWIIAGKIKVNRILSNEEVEKICLSNNLTPQPVEK